MRPLELLRAVVLAGLVGCSTPSAAPQAVGGWHTATLTPGTPVSISLGGIGAAERGELELARVPENTTWVAVADGRELAAGRLFPSTSGLYGLHTGGGPLQVRFTLPATASASEISYRLRLRPAFFDEEDEALTSGPARCERSGCTGVLGWPADSDRFLIASQGGAGTEIRLSPMPGIAWDVWVNEGPNLRAQGASGPGAGLSVVVNGASNNLVVSLRSRTDGSSPLPYRMTLRGLGGPVVRP